MLQFRPQQWVDATRERGERMMDRARWKRGWVSLCATGGVLLFAVVSWAQPAPTLDLKTTAATEIMVRKNGHLVAERVPVAASRPGDVIVYTIAYRNRATAAIVDASVVDPVPAGTVYVLASAEGADTQVTCSIDGGRSYQAPPVTARVKAPDGSEKSVPVPAARYTHIKWVIGKPVPPGSSGQVSMKVTVR
jgi:uncharacterized repeat protein (TIGR01451 family)